MHLCSSIQVYRLVHKLPIPQILRRHCLLFRFRIIHWQYTRAFLAPQICLRLVVWKKDCSSTYICSELRKNGTLGDTGHPVLVGSVFCSFHNKLDKEHMRQCSEWWKRRAASRHYLNNNWVSAINKLSLTANISPASLAKSVFLCFSSTLFGCCSGLLIFPILPPTCLPSWSFHPNQTK